jgi:alkylation response protein AidB-like acyl-CoA dehydrogenase
MDFNLSPDEEKFRQELRLFLDENLPPESERGAEFYAGWFKQMREKRWVGFSWPVEYGGGGGSLMEQVILKEEMVKRKAPPLGTCYMGLAWVGPGLIQYGTDEQKRRFLPWTESTSGAPATRSRAPEATSPRCSASACARGTSTS